jgi:hypothetical protein
MKLYGSFLIRCWIYSGEEQTQKFVFDVEHIQGGERLRFNSYDEAWQWMTQILQSDSSKHEHEKPITNEHSYEVRQ